MGHKFTSPKKNLRLFKKGLDSFLVCRYSSRPPNGWNNLMKIRQGTRLETEQAWGKKRR